MRIVKVHTLVLGSGASGLAAAVRLKAEGVDVAILTEGLNRGTSINTGSDKQTYYKLGLCGATPDSPRSMAESYTSSGATDGDLALVEASTSTRAFFHLVNLGVPFPRDAFGQYAGYKTDHDPAKRATSCGPYTSREMCRALIREVRRLNVPVFEDQVAVKLLAVDAERGATSDLPRRKIVGVVALSKEETIVYRVKNLVFAVGGPGGLYQTSVYPEVHTGAIGLALEIGALARNLPESQFGLASFTKLEEREWKGEGERPKEFRWNVSGSYMQVVPKFVSTAPDGVSDSREFLFDYFSDPSDLFGRVFLKGYQWPFDARKAVDGSSFVDLCVFYETAVLGRRVFLDYRENPKDFDFQRLPTEAFEYLQKSNALGATPFERLRQMNPNAIALYRDNGVDLATEPLEIAVCAQHNNGGLAVDVWSRSLNVEGLYPIGEVAGTHGAARPGGPAPNAGQVWAFRAAERIAFELRRGEDADDWTDEQFETYAENVVALLFAVATERARKLDWRVEREALRRRMSASGGIFRSRDILNRASREAREQLRRLQTPDDSSADRFVSTSNDVLETLRNVQLCVSQVAYLDAIFAEVQAGVGSRGSSLTLSSDGRAISDKFPNDWKIQDEDASFRAKSLYTYCVQKSELEDDLFQTCSFWRDVKPTPAPDEWFENVWRDFREDKIFETGRGYLDVDVK